MPRSVYTADDIRRFLRQLVEQHKTQRAAAEALGVSPQFLNQCLTNKTLPTGAILDTLGFKKETAYVRK